MSTTFENKDSLVYPTQSWDFDLFKKIVNNLKTNNIEICPDMLSQYNVHYYWHSVGPNTFYEFSFIDFSFFPIVTSYRIYVS